MSNGSPTAYLLWAILSVTFLGFLLLHLWSYDRFKCLKWSSGRQPGAFKRVMTYSYIGTVPLIIVFSVAMTVLKYKEGFVLMPDGCITPRPYALWQKVHRDLILPMWFILASAWALEIVTHLEELTFWLYLLHQGPGKREWFQSWEFRTWYLGSVVAVLGMPVTTLVTRQQLETCQAWIFLVGSSAGTSTNICFFYVLARFPGFIAHVKAEGAEPDVVVRLATFYQLNRIRVAFRFLFTLPLLILAVDVLQGPHRVVRDPFATDFLLMVAAIGSTISSAITLLVFFPRSITRESGYKAKSSITHNSPKLAPVQSTGAPHVSALASPDSPSALQSYHYPRTPVVSPISNEFSMASRSPTSGRKMRGFRMSDVDADGGKGASQRLTRIGSRNGDRKRTVVDLHRRKSDRSVRSGESGFSPGYETDAESFEDYDPRVARWSAGTDGAGASGPSEQHDHQQHYSKHLPQLRRPAGAFLSSPSQTQQGSTRRHEEPPWDNNVQDRNTLRESWGSGARKRYSDSTRIGEGSRRVRGKRKMADRDGSAEGEEAEGEGDNEDQLHPYLRNFTSPIDLMDVPDNRRPWSRAV